MGVGGAGRGAGSPWGGSGAAERGWGGRGPGGAVSGRGWGFPVSLIVLPRRATLSRALLRRVAARSPAATLDRPSRHGKTKTAGKPPKERDGCSLDMRPYQRPFGVVGGRLAKHPGRQDCHPGPRSAPDRYALLPSQRLPAAWGRCPHQRPTGSSSGAGGRHKSLRAPPVPASDGRLGLIPAPNDEQVGIRACGRARSLRAPLVSASGRRLGRISAPDRLVVAVEVDGFAEGGGVRVLVGLFGLLLGL
ncbi:hypothetical protein BX286_3331 [Streptomyces sp. 3211.6]|nr:hypothetical protein BX286_3331 [Streptomyces sp. 3211.6]